jgi:hypothetical protein
MRQIHGLDEAEHQPRDELPVAQFVIQVLPPGGEARLRIYPLINDHARAPACYQALMALARQWLEEPSALAALCELPAPAGSTERPRA